MTDLLHSKIIGSGKPLVILHGLFGMLDNWQGLAKEFGQFFETHIVDQRNHGRSFHANAHNYELMCADLLTYLDANGLDKVFLLGHSMGGKTAMLFATMYPERVEKLVVVDIAPKYYAPHHQEILAGLHAIENAAITSRKEADIILAKHFPQIGIRQFLLKNLYWKTKEELCFKFNLKVLSNEIKHVGEPLIDDAIFYEPTLFVDGQNSNYILPEDQELIETHFPDAQIVEVAKAGHWVHAENPTDFFEEVSRFLIY
ncbi:MAG: alpha/beta fold hydrolase [Flavobacteriales bacterium]|jgi:esterase|tara:strand:+ start:7714 stop:8484 length:771 start_codon:yes stop_codon:yes gene_type:complete